MKPSERINRNCIVDECSVEILLANGPVRAPVKVSIELSSRPQLILEYELPSTAYAESNEINEKGEVKVRLDNGTTFEAVVGNRQGLGGGKVWNVLIPKLEPVTVRDDNQLLSCCRFSLINFPNMWGDDDVWQSNSPDGNSSTLVAQRFHLEDPPWIVTMDAVEDLMSMHYSLTRRGGSAITHHGTITRTDSREFSVDGLAKLLDALHLFLSFTRGSYCGITYLEGQDTNGKGVWQQWGTYRVEPWRRPLQSWSDESKSHSLSSVFKGFRNLLNNPSQSDTVSQVVNWYLRSNESSEPEVSVVLTQAALERLSYHIIGSKNSKTGEWINQALVQTGINTQIPADCPELIQLNRQHNWRHGPHALVNIRNNLAHASNNIGTISATAMMEAQALGLHYVELMLLHLSGFCGNYMNRLKRSGGYVSQVEPVPWAPVSNP